MARKINYDNWSKEELIKELRRIKETKYGLVWHRDLPEEKIDALINPDARTPSEMFPNEMAGRPFPVLKEVKSKEIKTATAKPVNLLIEGDNYHSLAVLNFTHHQSVDLIYIDPPYNTGSKDFKYNDKFVDIEDSFRHSKWLSFMEKRLKLAFHLLKDEGAIFISIDDHEVAQLKMLCDEIFSERNFVDLITWEKKSSAKGVPPTNMLVNVHEYILVYKKSDDFSFVGEPRSQEGFSNPDNDPRGPWRNTNIKSTIKDKSAAFTIRDPDTGNTFTDTWAYSKDELERLIKERYLIFPKNKNGQVRKKEFFKEFKHENIPVKSSWGLFDNQKNTEMLKGLLGDVVFLNPKPLDLLTYLLKSAAKKDAIIVDFFAGSGTTGHAILKLNKEDGGSRQFILCTNDEEIGNNGEKIKHRICTDVCYPRLKKIIRGYKSNKGESIAGLGGNLKYYTCDFVEAEPTDKNKRKLVDESTEMLCIRENAFDLVQDGGDFKIFKNNDKYLGIVFYEEAINAFKKAIKKIKGNFNVYVFSLGDDPHEKQFNDVKDRVTLCAIPEVILKVYREIFK